MLKNPREGIEPQEPGKVGPIKQLAALQAKGNLVAYVGDVVGTGSSRKSATNSVLWFTGEDIPYVPNKRFGGVCLGSKIAPIFYNTMEDAGALPIELDVSNMNMGDVIELRPYEGKALKDGKVIAEFKVTEFSLTVLTCLASNSMARTIPGALFDERSSSADCAASRDKRYSISSSPKSSFSPT